MTRGASTSPQSCVLTPNPTSSYPIQPQPPTHQGTSFAPTCEQLQTIIAAMFDAMIATVNTVNRVLYLKIFHERLGGVVRNGPVVSAIIRASAAFQRIGTGGAGD